MFPQLAIVCGVKQRLALKRKPAVAWCFNLGAAYGGLKRAAARAALAHIDRFVVHSRAEVDRYAEWLELPPGRFTFVPLQRSPIPVEEKEDERRPFILAMGSAKRDYATLVEAVRQSKHPTVIVAAQHAIEGLAIPENVQVLGSLSASECHRLSQRARINVVTVLNDQTASGQVTIVEAMGMGRAVIATRCIGSEDYVEHGVTGVMVPPRSVESLRSAIDQLWQDANLRDRLGTNAARFVAKYCSDEAAGEALRHVLDDVEDSWE